MLNAERRPITVVCGSPITLDLAEDVHDPIASHPVKAFNVAPELPRPLAAAALLIAVLP